MTAQLKEKIFKNNPINYSENDKEYLDRKEKQVGHYIEMIASGKYDFCFFQEVDFFTRKLNDTQSERRRVELKNRFIGKIKDLGWEFSNTNGALNCKPMVTIYNKSTLSHSEKSGLMPDGNNKNTVFENIFTYNKGGKKIALANMHLDYDKEDESCKNALKEYLMRNTALGILTIAGSDTNHPYFNMGSCEVGCKGYATSFDFDENIQKLSIRHRESGEKSTIDRFFVGPSIEKQSIEGAIIAGYHFDENLKLHSVPTQGVVGDTFNLPCFTPAFNRSVLATDKNDDTHRVTNDDLREALTYIEPSFFHNKDVNNRRIATPGLFYNKDEGRYIIQIIHDNRYLLQDANNKLSKLSGKLFNAVSIQRAPHRALKLPVEGSIEQGGDTYRVLRLTDKQAIDIVNYAKRKPVARI